MDGSQNLPVPSFTRHDNLSEECKNLISSLPSEKDPLGLTLYNYKGCWSFCNAIQGILDVEKHFRPRDTDIIVSSLPKSGTTWLKALVFALVERGKYGVDSKNHPLLHENPHTLVPFLELKLYYNRQIPDLTEFPTPRLFGTHMPINMLCEIVKDSSCKIVYICRNPKDAMVSNWHFTRQMHHKDLDNQTREDMFNAYHRGVHFYGPFWDHVLGYWNHSLKHPKQLFFITYEEMQKNPQVQLKRLAEFLNCPFSEEEEKHGLVDDILELCSLSNLREVNKNGKTNFGTSYNIFFRKGEVGDWKNHLTSDMTRKLDEIMEEKLQGSGLKFE